MKLIIDIPEEDYKRGTLSEYFGCWSMKLHDTILNGTPIPDNATNGDVIKVMFPNMKVDVSGGVIKADRYTQFDLSWWNAPYQKGGK